MDDIYNELKIKASELSEYDFMVWTMKRELFSNKQHAERFYQLRQEEKNKGSFYNESNSFDFNDEIC
jgi:hypothetical protein